MPPIRISLLASSSQVALSTPRERGFSKLRKSVAKIAADKKKRRTTTIEITVKFERKNRSSGIKTAGLWDEAPPTSALF